MNDERAYLVGLVALCFCIIALVGNSIYEEKRTQGELETVWQFLVDFKSDFIGWFSEPAHTYTETTSTQTDVITVKEPLCLNWYTNSCYCDIKCGKCWEHGKEVLSCPAE